MTLAADDLADEMDLASSEYLRLFTFRLRGRETAFWKNRSGAGKDPRGFVWCLRKCDELISIKELEARLETTLCIRCKEDQARLENAYG